MIYPIKAWISIYLMKAEGGVGRTLLVIDIILPN